MSGDDFACEGSAAVKRCKSDDVSSESSEDDDDDSWAPSSDDEVGGELDDALIERACNATQYSTRSRGMVSFPSGMDDLNAVMDRVDEDVDRESDLSSDSDIEEEEEEDDSDDSDDSEEEESEDDDYSDDDSFVTSDDDEPTADSPVTLSRCDAGIPPLDDGALNGVGKA